MQSINFFTIKLLIIATYCIISSIFPSKGQVYDRITRGTTTNALIPISDKNKNMGKGRTEFAYHIGTGTFSMDGIKNLQRTAFTEQNYTVTKEPACYTNIIHSLSLGYRTKRASGGIQAELLSTDIKASFNQLNSNFHCTGSYLSIYLDYIFSNDIFLNNFFESGLRCNLGTVMTNIKMDDFIHYSDNNVNEFRSIGLVLKPTLFTRLSCTDRLSVEVEGGYVFNVNGNLGMKSNLADKLFINNTMYSPDWEGVRINIGLIVSL